MDDRPTIPRTSITHRFNAECTWIFPIPPDANVPRGSGGYFFGPAVKLGTPQEERAVIGLRVASGGVPTSALLATGHRLPVLTGPLEIRCQHDLEALTDEAREVGKPVYVHFSDGFEALVFRRPIKLRTSRKWKEAGKRPSRSKQRSTNDQIACVALLEGKVRVLRDYPVVTLYHERFDISLRLNFDTVSKFTPGQVLAPERPLTRAFDPLFAQPNDDPGTPNALTNFESVSLPLVRPDDDSAWERPPYDAVASLKAVPKCSWASLLELLEGEFLASVDSVLRDERVVMEESARTRSNGKSDPRPRKVKGKCYKRRPDDPAPILVGPYLVFKVRCGSRTVGFVDSPLYGVALRVFCDPDTALRWACGGTDRKSIEADSTKQLAPRIIHDVRGHWMATVNALIDQLSAEAPNVDQ